MQGKPRQHLPVQWASLAVPIFACGAHLVSTDDSLEELVLAGLFYLQDWEKHLDSHLGMGKVTSRDLEAQVGA